MRKTTLNRQSHRKPDLKALHEMKEYLEDILYGNIEIVECEWVEMLEEIMAFQYEDGSFNLLDSYRIESDCRVDYCHEPTYLCTAILMKALLEDEKALGGREMKILPPAMHMCCARGLQGHGYDALQGLIHAVNYFMKSDVKRFLRKYPKMCPEFTEMFCDIEKYFTGRVDKGAFCGAWGEDYERAILAIDEYFRNYIFVYGTLMEGQPNHDVFLRYNTKVADGYITGYEMYDLGSYPGIKKGNGQVYGEVYCVTEEELAEIDRLEGEGFLYLRVPVTVITDSEKSIEAAVYVYNGAIDGCPKLSEKYGQDEYVWYVSYGSNLLEERLCYYIQGGYCKQNGKIKYPCTDTTLPTEKQPVKIPFNMYYANYNMES